MWLSKAASSRVAAGPLVAISSGPSSRSIESVMSVRVIVADDRELARTGFRVILNSGPDIEVGSEAAMVAKRSKPPDN